MGALEELVASQAQKTANRTAADIDRLYRPRRSELLYFVENGETIRLLRESASERAEGRDGRPSTAPDPRDHLTRAWETLGGSLRGLEILSPEGGTVFAVGRLFLTPSPERGLGSGFSDPVVVEDVEDPETGIFLGSVRASLDPSVLSSSASETSGFGALGEVVVVDRDTRRIITGSRAAQALVGLGEQALSGFWQEEPVEEGRAWMSPDTASAVGFNSGDSLWVCAVAAIPHSPWAVLSIASVDEFAAGVTRTGKATLLIVALIAVLTLGVGMFATKRAMGSLETLTLAARGISAGDLSPELPEPGPDEVGTLARAFQVMVHAVDGMLKRVEESRQMAAVGEFASQVAHEIRNPLTAIRINLQALQRDLAHSPLAREHGRPLEITIGEVDRLDRVTRGVLALAQRPMGDPVPVHVHREILITIETLRPDLEAMDVSAETFLGADTDEVLADGPALRGALMNLIRNAAEAMPDGGTVRLRSEMTGATGESRRFRLHVTDEGPGIPESVRSRLFHPFVSTKTEGTGLGLTVALRTVEAHGGRLWVEDEGSGGHFVMELPLASRPEDADCEAPGGSPEFAPGSPGPYPEAKA